jgi:hypothetical protein
MDAVAVPLLLLLLLPALLTEGLTDPLLGWGCGRGWRPLAAAAAAAAAAGGLLGALVRPMVGYQLCQHQLLLLLLLLLLVGCCLLLLLLVGCCLLLQQPHRHWLQPASCQHLQWPLLL